ncbi:Carnitine O-palmitoyltransferase 1, liver isoform [Armadillidium nasatum]|uniref:Carnitine O-palmitoyltransferase 1, liver isoform n=1 Tax=Armadillidium nasatum TaxID=96803 RepID=A0A5N5SKH4_9CRUS|nr:Carnitine O-palmitoyltransferase 1, liver isoform [Armadillidium nasatum]
MADARIAVATPLVRKEDDGTASSWKDVYKSYRIILLRNYFRLRNSIKNGMFPTSTNYLIVACGFSVYLLEFRPHHFETLETVANFLCNVSEKIPMPEGTPVWLYHIVFSAGVSVTFFLVLMKLRQYTIRMLLSYTGWMNKLLDSLEPLCTEEELNEYRKGAAHLQKTIGGRLQRILEKYAYLRSRLPLAINSNYYAFDHYSWVPTKNQSSRAANLVYSFLYMKRQIDREELRPLAIRNTIPVCMAQYERLFSTYRVPGIEMDELVNYESSKSRHIVVYFDGIYYCVTVYDSGNQPLCPSTLEKIFQDIMEDAKAQPKTDDSSRNIAALTTLPRSDWARILKKHFTDGVNAESLDIIKRSICMVVLYDQVPKDICEKGKMLLHGTGSSLFDKCLSVCVFPDGQCGMNVEHTFADAPVLGHIWEYTMSMEVIEKRYLDTGEVMPPPKSFKQRKFPHPSKLAWDLPLTLQAEVKKALAFSIKNNDDLDLILNNHTRFGKGFIKSVRISPDAFIQIALQFAYYRDAGKFCQTYEASSTRIYQHGRTETIRSCTKESCKFVRAMVDRKKSKEELILLLRKAAEKHRKLYFEAMRGKGLDRHIFALYVVSKGLGYSNKFLEDILSRPWTLSTSQQPQQQIQHEMPDINLDAFRKMVSPGGGFGPVSDDGYGVSYMLPTEYNIFFHVSSKKSSSQTSSQRFVELIEKSMAEMKELFDK